MWIHILQASFCPRGSSAQWKEREVPVLLGSATAHEKQNHYKKQKPGSNAARILKFI